MKTISNPLFLLVMIFLFLGLETNATNGYFSHGYGIRSKGMAGTGVSFFYSAMGSATNPAGLVNVGTRYDVNVALFNPNREFTVTGNPSGFPGTFGLAPTTVESNKPSFIVPSIAGNWMLNDDSSIGVALYGNGGMNTEYPSIQGTGGELGIFGGSFPTGVNLAQMFLNVTYSRKLGENHSVGISAIGAYQMFEATGLEAFAGFSSDGTSITNNDTDNSSGFGFRIGYMGEIAPGLRLGASYQSQMFMSEFEDYAGLFAEQGGFNIPSSWTAGLSYEFTDWLFAFDVQQIMYSDVASIANPVDPTALPPAFPDGTGGFTPNPNHVPLGDDDGSGFGWDDMMIFKLGTQFSGVETWKFRAGYSFGSQPIPESEMMFNILAPGVIEQHATFGLSKAINDRNEISFAMMYAFTNEISGPNLFEAPDAQTIELKMNQLEFEVGFSF